MPKKYFTIEEANRGIPKISKLLKQAKSLGKAIDELSSIKISFTEEISNFIINRFYDATNGGLFDRIKKENDVGMLNIRIKNFLENSFCAVACLKMHKLSDNVKYKTLAESTLKSFGNSYLNYGYFSATYANALSTIFA